MLSFYGVERVEHLHQCLLSLLGIVPVGIEDGFEALAVDRAQFLLEMLGEQFVAPLAQKHEQLRPFDAFHHHPLGRGGVYRWTPESWTHGTLPLLATTTSP